MPYSIHFVGLTCLIKNGNTYRAVLPDGRRYHDPCTNTDIHDHNPYLIIPIASLASSYAPGILLADCFIVDLTSAGTLLCEHAGNVGPFDDSDLQANGYRWQDFDPAFQLGANDPQNVILSVDLRQGTFKACRLAGARSPDEDAVLTSVYINARTAGFFKVFAGNQEITVRDGAELVIANVAPEWLEDVKYPDEDNHFFIYHRLSSLGTGGCIKPSGKLPDETLAKHPYLKASRGLRVSCSNTTYP